MAKHGHRLQPENCIEHYQNQIGNANPYFSSDFPIQRGYGFFSSLHRYALPLMMQAGKYLGLGVAYFDLSHVLLNIQAKILKADGTAFTADDKCGPINYLLNTMFPECHISLNDRHISSESNYAYKTYIQSTLFHSESSQKDFLQAAMFYKGTPGAFDNTDLTPAAKNLGLKQRYERVKEGKIFDMCGILHIDLGMQPRLLISGTTVRVRLLKAKDDFCLLAKTSAFRLQIENISLFIQKCDVSSSIVIAHEKTLEQALVQMSFTRIETKTFTLSSGLKSV
ncbi:hypothetical protein AVEN_153486-1 [Araneus ventricosus]|uniref:Uncharacterized protein n=1 Tax=Araneus ventricosus TaxID=182803 RepID=A0A4Y2K5N6_ARAVE|nr:hypothetical protein AVEN_153486-1 [Araneus ventricosus]